MPARQIANSVTVITGASSGIGAATARMIAEQGGNLVLAARRMDKLEAVAAECRSLQQKRGGKATTAALPCDVANRESVHELVAKTIAKFNRLDTMLANAGYGFLAKIQETTEQQFDDIMATNVKGTWYCMQAAGEIMARQSPDAGGYRGQIIAVSSGAARRGLPLYGVYSMTKAAQLSLVEAMRVEVKKQKIAVSTVHPLTTATEFFDVASSKSRMRSTGISHAAPAEKVAKSIVKLMKHPRPEAWPVWGSAWLLALAATFPSLGDFVMAKSVGQRTR